VHRKLNDDQPTVSSDPNAGNYNTILDPNSYSNETHLITNTSLEDKNLPINDTNSHPQPESSLITFTFQEILLFSAVISATDTVAALTFISETKEQKLYSILFGEGVINDAVCIVLYKIIRDFTKTGQGKII